MLTRAFLVSSLAVVAACGAAPSPVPAPPSRPVSPSAQPARKDLRESTALRVVPEPEPPPGFSDPERDAKLAALVPRLEKKIDELFAREKPPSLAVAMVVDGRVVLRRILGVRDVVSKVPATEHTLYRIGSITKTFTAAAVLALRDAGVLSLDEPADRWVPELARVQYPHADAPRITLRHLLTHTSGLPRVGAIDYVSRPDVDVSEAEMLDALEKAKLESAPGTKYAYSNLAVSVAGLIVGRAAKAKSLRGAMKELVTGPLGMTTTTFDPATLVPRPADIATGYAKNTDTSPAPPWRLGASEASGGLWASLDDMTKWIAFQLAAWPPRAGAETGPLRRASVREAHIPGFPLGLTASLEGARLAASSDAIGLGWHTSSTCPYERIVKHSGAIDGFNSSVGFAPDRGFGFVVLESSIDSDATVVRDALFEEVAASGALGPRSPRPAPDFEQLARKLATFRCEAAEHEALFSASFREHVPFSAYESICKNFATRHGACALEPMSTLDSAMSGTIRMKCERGEIAGLLFVVPEPGTGARVEGLRLRSRGFTPSRRLLDVAADVLALEGKWDAARFGRAGFIPAITAADLESGLAQVRAQSGTCRLAPGADKSRNGDGAKGARFELACERGGSAQLIVGVDDKGKIDEARFEPAEKPAGSRCVDPPRK